LSPIVLPLIASDSELVEFHAQKKEISRMMKLEGV